jgi:hypoxanthine phosphoribosyltransferase
MARRLPYAITDRLRVIEDRIGQQEPLTIPAPTETLTEELTRIGEEVVAKGIQRVAVVDDAVDSGATLACVMRTLRESLPASVEVRSAVITTTRLPELTAGHPDFKIYDLTLLRFPWSFDYKSTR